MENKNQLNKHIKIEQKILHILKLRLSIENISYKDEELKKIITQIVNLYGKINWFPVDEINNVVDGIVEELKCNNLEDTNNYSSLTENHTQIHPADSSLKKTRSTSCRTIQNNFSSSGLPNISKTNKMIELKLNKKLDKTKDFRPSNKYHIRHKQPPLKFNQYQNIEKESIKFYSDSLSSSNVEVLPSKLQENIIENYQKEIDIKKSKYNKLKDLLGNFNKLLY
jgi:hypothetical protein